MADVISELLALFGIDLVNAAPTNLAEFIPFATKLLVGAAFYGVVYRFFFNFSSDAATGKLL